MERILWSREFWVRNYTVTISFYNNWYWQKVRDLTWLYLDLGPVSVELEW